MADANLRSYWNDCPTPEVTVELIRWVIDQMRGMESALNVLHNFNVPPSLTVLGAVLSISKGEEKYGRHGDIKPENILWFSKENTLKITDFGLGRFHGRDSWSGIDPRTVGGTVTYEPPERALRNPLSRASDIWNIGCVYLEFVTWPLMGLDGLQKFTDVRISFHYQMGIDCDTFYEIIRTPDGLKATIKESVTRWIRNLQRNPKCSDSLRDVLSLIEEHLLVVDPNHRMGSHDVEQILEKILGRGKNDSQYLFNDTSLQRRSRKSALRHGSSSEDLDKELVKRKKLSRPFYSTPWN